MHVQYEGHHSSMFLIRGIRLVAPVPCCDRPQSPLPVEKQATVNKYIYIYIYHSEYNHLKSVTADQQEKQVSS